MSNQHDKRYKRLFSNKSLVKELFESFVNESISTEIDFNSLERLDKSFITDKFKEKESDLIYRVNLKEKSCYIYLLIEFQSTVDPSMSLRILRYICEFYEFLTENEKMTTLPAVFPLLLYNGEGKWTSKENIFDMIEQTIPEKYIPKFRYYKVIINEFSKTVLKKIRNIVSAIFYVENSDLNELKEEIAELLEMIKGEKPELIKLFASWVNNYLNEKEPEIIEDIRMLEEVKTMLATSLDKQRKLWYDEGLKDGEDKGKIEAAKKMIVEGFDISVINKITGLTEKEIEKLK